MESAGLYVEQAATRSSAREKSAPVRRAFPVLLLVNGFGQGQHDLAASGGRTDAVGDRRARLVQPGNRLAGRRRSVPATRAIPAAGRRPVCNHATYSWPRPSRNSISRETVEEPRFLARLRILVGDVGGELVGRPRQPLYSATVDQCQVGDVRRRFLPERKVVGRRRRAGRRRWRRPQAGRS